MIEKGYLKHSFKVKVNTLNRSYRFAQQPMLLFGKKMLKIPKQIAWDIMKRIYFNYFLQLRLFFHNYWSSFYA